MANRSPLEDKQSPFLQNLFVGFPCHIDGIPRNEANLAHELSREFFSSLWRQATCVETVDGGRIHACLPYPQLVSSGEGVPATEDAG